MGLDITAYERVERVADHLPPNGYCNEHTPLLLADGFEDRADGLREGCHITSGERFGFRAGSYSGYNVWREALATLAGYPAVLGALHSPHATSAWKHEDETRDLPFHALINFSDCEGVIGPETSAKLAADFAAFDERARIAWAKDDPYDYERYVNWRRAFEIAAGHGVVDFH